MHIAIRKSLEHEIAMTRLSASSFCLYALSLTRHEERPSLPLLGNTFLPVRLDGYSFGASLAYVGSGSGDGGYGNSDGSGFLSSPPPLVYEKAVV